MEEEKENINAKEEVNKTEKSKARKLIVLVVLILAAVVAYVIFRGEYLEIKEIGEKVLGIVQVNSFITTLPLISPSFVIVILPLLGFVPSKLNSTSLVSELVTFPLLKLIVIGLLIPSMSSSNIVW